MWTKKMMKRCPSHVMSDAASQIAIDFAPAKKIGQVIKR
jgi:hypothetical protein